MNHKSPIRDAKGKVLSILKSKEELKHLDIRQTYLNANVDLPLKKPLLTVTRGQIISSPIGLRDYVGNRIREDKYIELRGKELTLKYELHIWNNNSPKWGGEDEIERIKEILFEEFEFYPKISDGIRVIDFKDGDTMEDPFEEGLFHSRCVLKLRALWIKEFEYDLLEEIQGHIEIID